MIIIQTVTAPANEVPDNTNQLKKMPLTVLQKRWIDNDIILNVYFREILLRGAIVLFLPLQLLAVNHDLLFYAAPVMSYLLATALLFLLSLPGSIG